MANDAPYFEVAQLDRPEVRIAVGQGAAYDLFCRVRCSRRSWCGRLLPPRRSRCFRTGLEAAAGVRQPLLAAAAAHPGYRVLEGISPPSARRWRCRGKTQGAAYVNDFIERCKANGLVKAALQRSGQGEVTVAPPAASA